MPIASPEAPTQLVVDKDRHTKPTIANESVTQVKLDIEDIYQYPNKL